MTRWTGIVAAGFLALIACPDALLAGPARADDNVPDLPAASQALVWMPRDGDEIRFDVLRQGKPFGSHIVRFDVAENGMVTARTDVKLRAGFGPIPLYRYDLAATGRWKGGRLIELTGKVNKDGREGSVTARAHGDVIEVDGSGYRGTVPAATLPASHWNIAGTGATVLLSAENGQPLDVSVTRIGRETVTVAGQAVEANKYLLDSDIDVTLWYDDAGRWVKLAFTARGQQIDYVLAEPFWGDRDPAGAP